MAQKHRPTSAPPSPLPGESESGRPFEPGAPDASPAEPSSSETRPMPAPGVPIPAGEYERLKDEARRRRAPSDGPAQEDPGPC